MISYERDDAINFYFIEKQVLVDQYAWHEIIMTSDVSLWFDYYNTTPIFEGECTLSYIVHLLTKTFYISH